MQQYVEHFSAMVFNYSKKYFFWSKLVLTYMMSKYDFFEIFEFLKGLSV